MEQPNQEVQNVMHLKGKQLSTDLYPFFANSIKDDGQVDKSNPSLVRLSGYCCTQKSKAYFLSPQELYLLRKCA